MKINEILIIDVAGNKLCFWQQLHCSHESVSLEYQSLIESVAGEGEDVGCCYSNCNCTCSAQKVWCSHERSGSGHLVCCLLWASSLTAELQGQDACMQQHCSTVYITTRFIVGSESECKFWLTEYSLAIYFNAEKLSPCTLLCFSDPHLWNANKACKTNGIASKDGFDKTAVHLII